MCGRAYTEWVWPLLTVHPGEREGGKKEGKAGTRTGEVEVEVEGGLGGEKRRQSKEKRSKRQMR